MTSNSISLSPSLHSSLAPFNPFNPFNPFPPLPELIADAPLPSSADHLAEAGSAARAEARPARKRVLVVRLDAIGDWILCRNALHALRRSARFADTHWTILGNPAWRGLAEAFDKDLADEWIWVERRDDLFRKGYENLLPRSIWHRRVAKAQARLREKLAAGRYDIVLSLQPSRDPLLDELVAGLAPEVVGVRADGLDSSMYTRLLNPGPEPFVFLRNRSIASALASEPCDVPLTLGLPASSSRDEVLVFTGASHWTRRWPRRRVRALVRLLLDRTSSRVILADGASRSDLHSFAASFRSDRVEALPPQSLADFAKRIASVRAVVTNDTMALHLAAAASTPVVGIVNGVSGRDDFWPYPESLDKRVAIVGAEPLHKPVAFLPRLIASQISQYRNLSDNQTLEAYSNLEMVATHTPPCSKQLLPLASFCIKCFNQSQFIGPALDGAFSQTYRPLEIVISDDCSTDGSSEIIQRKIREYKSAGGDIPVIFQANSENLGNLGNWIVFGRIAHGDILVKADGDDISIPERTERIVEAWIANGRQAKLVDHCGSVMDVEGKHLNGIVKFNGSCQAYTHDLWDRFPIQTAIAKGCRVYDDFVFCARAYALAGEHCRIELPLLLTKYRHGSGATTSAPNYRDRVLTDWMNVRDSHAHALAELRANHDSLSPDLFESSLEKVGKRMQEASLNTILLGRTSKLREKLAAISDLRRQFGCRSVHDTLFQIVFLLPHRIGDALLAPYFKFFYFTRAYAW